MGFFTSHLGSWPFECWPESYMLHKFEAHPLAQTNQASAQKQIGYLFLTFLILKWPALGTLPFFHTTEKTGNFWKSKQYYSLWQKHSRTRHSIASNIWLLLWSLKARRWVWFSSPLSFSFIELIRSFGICPVVVLDFISEIDEAYPHHFRKEFI